MVKNLSFKQRLKQIGLSDNEATVYLAVLEKGRITPTEVAKETDLNHVTSYRVLKYLVEKGLISENREGKKKLYFNVEDPDRIRKYLRLKKNEIDEQEKYLDDLLPNLKAVFWGHKKLKIDFFEGKEGVYWLQEEMAKIALSVTETYNIVPLDSVKKNFPFKKMDPRMKFKGKKSWLIYTSALEKVRQTTAKYVDSKDLETEVELAVTGDYTAIYTLGKEMSGILIRDCEISDFFKKLILLLYKTLP